MIKKVFTLLSIALFASAPLWAQPATSQFTPGPYIRAAFYPVPYQYVKVQNGHIVTDFDRDGTYDSFLIKSVAYNPTPIGRFASDWGYRDPNDPRPDNLLDDDVILNRDFALLNSLNANSIRIYQGNNAMVTLDDANNPASPWYQQYQDIGRFTSFITKNTLDTAESYGIKVIAGFSMPWPGVLSCNGSTLNYTTFQGADYGNPAVRQKIKDDFVEFVKKWKNHKAILFWAIGNENNLGMSDQLNPTQITNYYSLIEEMAIAARAEEGAFYHPVAIVNGDLGFIGNAQYNTTDAQLANVDIWGANVYRGISFGNLFNQYAALSNKAFWISEFGHDAWHSTDVNLPQLGYEDQTTQAAWVGGLWDEIESAYNSNQIVGGTVFEYSDEWWKDNEWFCAGPGYDFSYICNAQHSQIGTGPLDFSCPLDGTPDFFPPSPDSFWNKQWFGIFKIDRPTAAEVQPFEYDQMTPRPPVFNALQTRW